jgi:NAD-specific glutamate dehydrogenase
MLDGTAATLRTNFFNEDRYALSLRVSFSHTDTDPHADSDSDSAVNLNLLLSSLPSNLTLLNAHHSRSVPSHKVHPSIMMSGPPTASKPIPFGVFFCHGRHFNAFHCRFRDIARGEQ